MKTLRYCLTSLLLLMNTLMALATDDIIVNINPVQPVLPPQLGAYVSNPGAYFNVTVTNTTSKPAFIFFRMPLANMPNTTAPLEQRVQLDRRRNTRHSAQWRERRGHQWQELMPVLGAL